MISTKNVRNIRFDSGDQRQPRSVNLYFDHFQGRPIYRAVAYLMNSGCEWSRKTGGCTMCGTKNTALRRPIPDADFFAQLEIVRHHVLEFNASLDEPVQTLHIYNDGFFFNDDELTPTVRDAVCDLARSLKMRKLTVETNGLDIVRDHKGRNELGRTVKRLGETAFEVTLGVESADPQFRALYAKPDSLEDMRSALSIIRGQGAISKGYVLIKGPLVTEAEALADCVQTIRTLRDWSKGERFRVEFQPVCLLPNTLHEYLMGLPEDDPYRWEPPLLSTIFRILREFPNMGEDLYSALFARTDEDSPWDFWQNRPHDDPRTTFPMYRQLVEYYLHRRFTSIEEALRLADDSLWQQRKRVIAPHPLEERVRVVRKLLLLSKKAGMHLSDYLKTNLRRDGDFIESCRKHIAAVAD